MQKNVSERIEADVAIVGAGPAGTAAAARLGQLGVKNVVLVDRADFPRDKTCGSGLSPKAIQALKELGIWDDVAALAGHDLDGLVEALGEPRKKLSSGGPLQPGHAPAWAACDTPSPD